MIHLNNQIKRTMINLKSSLLAFFTKNLLPALCGIFLLTSCAPRYYAPSTQHVPLLSEKGELSITGSIGEYQKETNASYALTDHIGIIGYLGSFGVKNDNTESKGRSANTFHLGAGYFTPIKGHFIFESYGSLGFGKLINDFSFNNDSNNTYSTTGRLEAGVFSLGLQNNLGFKSKYFSVIFNTKLSSTNYQNISGDLVFQSEDQIKYLKENKNQLFFETGLTVRGGHKNVQVQVQAGRSFSLTNIEFYREDLLLTLGLNLRLITKK